MLSIMRKKAGSWMLKVILGVIAIVFVFWGFGPQGSKKTNKIASVNGKVITEEEYNKQYNDTLEEFRRTLGKNFNEDILKSLHLGKQVLDSIIERQLLLSEADKLNFRVTDDELDLNITRMPAFQNGGSFDQRKYSQVLQQAGMTAEAFRAMQREALLIEKLRIFITENVKVSEMEAEDWYQWENAEMNIEIVKFSPETYKNLQVTSDEIRSFYDTNKLNYKTETKIRAHYVRFNPDHYLSKIEIPDEEIQDYYESHLDKFEKPKTVEARHILIKVDLEAGEDVVQETKDRALAIMNMAKSGKDFAELAMQYSEDRNKANGGYVGVFRYSQMVKPFADKAFSMKKGEISEPVRTRFGWHIIKVEKINEAVKISEKEAKKEILTKLKTDRARTLAYDDAEAFYDVCLDAGDLQKAAEKEKISVTTTDFFSQTDAVKNVGEPEKFKNAAFALMEEEFSDIYDFNDGYYILQLAEKREARIPEMKEVEAQVRTDLIKEKSKQQAAEDARLFLDALKNGADIEIESRRYRVRPVSTGFFKREGEIPGIGYESDVSKAAFELSKNNPLPGKIVQGNNGIYVMRFKGRMAPDNSRFFEEKDDIIQGLLDKKKSNTFDRWLSQVKDNSEIEIEETFQNKL